MKQASQTAEAREKLAAVQHKIWSHWMQYLFSVGTHNQDGSYTIPRKEVERWQLQMKTSYSDLSEDEKKSDREQADLVIDTLGGE